MKFKTEITLKSKHNFSLSYLSQILQDPVLRFMTIKQYHQKWGAFKNLPNFLVTILHLKLNYTFSMSSSSSHAKTQEKRREMKQQLQQIHIIPPVERYRIISGLDRSISPPAEIYLYVYIYQHCPLWNTMYIAPCPITYADGESHFRYRSFFHEVNP